jgi:adenylate cyclase
VKGKLEPVKVYELLGAKGDVAEETLARMRRFEEGWDLYGEQKWDEAIAVFDEVLEGGPDGPAELYRERCRKYREDPPPENWGGVYVMTSK